LRQESFGLLDEAGDQAHRGEVVAEPAVAAFGEDGQGVIDEAEASQIRCQPNPGQSRLRNPGLCFDVW
jgi:hypothetical protein